MDKGQKIKFFIRDSLFKDTIIVTGTIINRHFRSLWFVKPDWHERLSGRDIIVHESCVLR